MTEQNSNDRVIEKLGGVDALINKQNMLTYQIKSKLVHSGGFKTDIISARNST